MSDDRLYNAATKVQDFDELCVCFTVFNQDFTEERGFFRGMLLHSLHFQVSYCLSFPLFFFLILFLVAKGFFLRKLLNFVCVDIAFLNIFVCRQSSCLDSIGTCVVEQEKKRVKNSYVYLWVHVFFWTEWRDACLWAHLFQCLLSHFYPISLSSSLKMIRIFLKKK